MDNERLVQGSELFCRVGSVRGRRLVDQVCRAILGLSGLTMPQRPHIQVALDRLLGVIGPLEHLVFGNENGALAIFAAQVGHMPLADGP